MVAKRASQKSLARQRQRRAVKRSTRPVEAGSQWMTSATIPEQDPQVECPLPATLLDIARERVNDCNAVLEDAKKRTDAETMHDLRVTTRRLAEVARLLGWTDLHDADDAKEIVAALRGLRRAAGEIRDLDAMLEHIKEWPGRAEMRPIFRAFALDAAQRRPALVEEVRERIGADGTRAAMLELADLLDQLQQRGEGAEVVATMIAGLQERIAERRRELRKAVKRAAKKQSAKSLHAARIAGKKLRYALELSAATGHEEHERQVSLLKQLQDDLGLVHDLDVLLEKIEESTPPREVKADGTFREAWKEWRAMLREKQENIVAKFVTGKEKWVMRQPLEEISSFQRDA